MSCRSRRLLLPSVTAAPPPHNRYALLNLFSALLLVFAFVLVSCIYLLRLIRRRRHPDSCSAASAAPIPGPESELHAIPVVSYGGDPPPSDRDCAICLGELVVGEDVRVLPRCGHVFHVDCIDRWLVVRSLHCPVCRDRTIQAAPPPNDGNCDGSAAHGRMRLNFATARYFAGNVPSYI